MLKQFEVTPQKTGLIGYGRIVTKHLGEYVGKKILITVEEIRSG